MNLNLAADNMGTRFSSTRQPAKAGRKPSKLKAWIKDFDVSKMDVDILARNIIWNYTYGDIQKLYNGLKGDQEIQDSMPLGVAVLISGMMHDVKRGDNRVINSLLDRLYGKAVDYNEMEYGKRIEQLEAIIKGTGKTVIDPSELDSPYTAELRQRLAETEQVKSDIEQRLLETENELKLLRSRVGNV